MREVTTCVNLLLTLTLVVVIYFGVKAYQIDEMSAITGYGFLGGCVTTTLLISNSQAIKQWWKSKRQRH